MIIVPNQVFIPLASCVCQGDTVFTLSVNYVLMFALYLAKIYQMAAIILRDVSYKYRLLMRLLYYIRIILRTNCPNPASLIQEPVGCLYANRIFMYFCIKSSIRTQGEVG